MKFLTHTDWAVLIANFESIKQQQYETKIILNPLFSLYALHFCSVDSC